MSDSCLASDLSVADVLARWPETIPVFLRHGMACVGCNMSAFETIASAAAVYGLDADSFLGELQQTIASAVKDDLT